MDTRRDLAQRVLDFWLACEYFSPQELKHVEESKDEDKAVVDVSTTGQVTWRNVPGRGLDVLPWELRGKATDNGIKRLQFVVCIGVVEIADVLAEVNARLGLRGDEDREEAQRLSGTTCIGSFLADGCGRPMPGSFVLCSWAWAMGRLATANPFQAQWLDGFETVRRELCEKFDAWARAKQAGDDNHSLTRQDLRRLLAEVLADINWPSPPLTKLAVVVPRTVQDTEEIEQIEFLNSFIANDLQRVRTALARGDVGDALLAYLGTGTTVRHDVRRKDEILQALHPGRWPEGRWPAAPDRPLVLSQQLGVNLALHMLAGGQALFSVNGPPGTGKTTLLRDIVAALVVKRALALARFRDPEAAFWRVRTTTTPW